MTGAGWSVYKCPVCGRFYSERTARKHRVCQMIEDEQNSGYRG